MPRLSKGLILHVHVRQYDIVWECIIDVFGLSLTDTDFYLALSLYETAWYLCIVCR